MLRSILRATKEELSMQKESFYRLELSNSKLSNIQLPHQDSSNFLEAQMEGFLFILLNSIIFLSFDHFLFSSEVRTRFLIDHLP